MAFDPNSLNAGDPVAYVNGHGLSRNDTCTFTTVARLTATQVILADGKRFHRKNGRMVGNFYCELVAANGPEATHARVLAARQRTANALYELQRAQPSGSPEAATQWLDRLADVVEQARIRIAEIMAEAVSDR